MNKSAFPTVLALGILATVLVMGNVQSQGPSGDHHRTSWPPRPADIVNLSGHEVIAPGEIHVLFEVPANEWLVVTDGDRVSNPVAVGDFGILEGGQFRRLLNATDFSEGYHSVTGLAFPPGTSVAVGNLHERTTVDVWWDVTGYLAR